MSVEQEFLLPSKYVAPNLWMAQNPPLYDHNMLEIFADFLGILCDEIPNDVEAFVKKYLLHLKLSTLKPPHIYEQIATKTPTQYKILVKALGQLEIFQFLNAEELLLLIMLIQPVILQPGEIIVERGKMVTSLFVLQWGSAHLVKDNKVEATLAAPTIFGSTSLVTDCNQPTTIYAQTALKLWALRSEDFRYVVLRSMRRTKRCRFCMLRYVPNTVELMQFTNDKEILKEGEVSEFFYIILEGRAKVSMSQKKLDGTKAEQLVELGPKDFFGELCLLYNKRSNVTVTSVGHLRCYALSKTKFMDTIKGWFQ